MDGGGGLIAWGVAWGIAWAEAASGERERERGCVCVRARARERGSSGGSVCGGERPRAEVLERRTCETERASGRKHGIRTGALQRRARKEEAKEGVHLRLRSGRSQGPASLESSRWLRAAASAAAAAGTTGVAAAAAAGSGTTGVACCAGADGA